MAARSFTWPDYAFCSDVYIFDRDLHAVPMTTKSRFYFCVWWRVTTIINSRLTDKPYHFEDTLEKADRLQPIGIRLQPIDNSRPAPEQVVGMEVMEPLGP